LDNGIIRQQAEVSDFAILKNSTAEGNANITGGEIIDSRVLGNVHGWPTIRNSHILQGVTIYDYPTIHTVDLFGTIKVYGRAKLSNLVISYVSASGDCLRIHDGVWAEPPRHVEMNGWTLSTCVNDRFHVGCYCKTLSHWINSRKFSRRMGWSDQDFDYAIQLFHSWLKA
jgi:hypothetical protein